MSGGQCVMTLGVVLMLQQSAGNLDMHTLDVSLPYCTTTWVDLGVGTWRWSVLVDEIFGHPAQRTEAPNKYGLKFVPSKGYFSTWTHNMKQTF